MIFPGDCLAVLPSLDRRSARCCVTSPPFYGLRDYEIAPSDWPIVAYAPLSDAAPITVAAASCVLGGEDTVAAYVAHLVHVCRLVAPVLADDGTIWLNLGDRFATKGEGGNGGRVPPKSLIGVPWRVALALQADGWLLRSDIIWHKPNAMPNPVKDRPNRDHEYLFLLAKSPRYYYDIDATRQPHKSADDPRNRADYRPKRERNVGGRTDGYTRAAGAMTWPEGGRNARTVWSIPTRSSHGVHRAVFPPDLPRRCILAGSAEGDTILDPFSGSGTTGREAEKLGRAYIGIEANKVYIPDLG